VSVPRQSAVWDRRRNTSQVHAVPPDALPRALSALRVLRATDPALVTWLQDGHPNLTEHEHRERFGCDYTRRPRRVA
jgi:hypothetical protein